MGQNCCFKDKGEPNTRIQKDKGVRGTGPPTCKTCQKLEPLYQEIERVLKVCETDLIKCYDSVLVQTLLKHLEGALLAEFKTIILNGGSIKGIETFAMDLLKNMVVNDLP